jgi:hypothetical protein
MKFENYETLLILINNFVIIRNSSFNITENAKVTVFQHLA